MSALNAYIDGQSAHAPLTDAAAAYMEFASGLSVAEQAEADSAGLAVLQSPSYWFDMETGTAQEQRAKRLICLKTIAQGQAFLSRLSTLVEVQADPLDLNDDAGDIKMLSLIHI